MMLYIVLVLALLGIPLSLRVEAYLRQLDQDTPPSIEAFVSDMGDDARQLTHDVKSRFSRTLARPNPALQTYFHEWVETHLNEEPDLQQWLLALSDSSFAVLTNRLNYSLRELDLHLIWLVDPAIRVEPSVEQVMRASVINYNRDYMRATALLPQFQAFRMYDQMLTQIAVGEIPPTAMQFILALEAHGLVEPTLSSLILANHADQRQQIVAQIREAATENPSLFEEIWADVVGTEAHPATS